MLDKLNLSEEPSYFNWFSKDQIDMIELESMAVRLGYENLNDALFYENSLIYSELMRAYGKDEFPEI
jgi:hypothetical protein